MKIRLSLALVGMFLFGAAASAHHSLAATYDQERVVTLEGRLVRFMFRNPHAFVHIEAQDSDGQLQRWAVEWGGATQLRGQGVTRSTFKVGDEVVITGNPSRTITDYRVKMNTLYRTADGFGWGTRPGEVVD